MELSIIRFIQSGSNGFWDSFFQLITQLGEAVPLVVLSLILYWTINKEKGLYVLYSLLLALNISFFLKDIFKLPRPIGEEGIRSLRVETAKGYAFPSGHTANTAALWSALAIAFKKNYLKIFAVVLIALVGLSRLYLGVHYPKDVLGGCIIGLGSAMLAYFLWRRLPNKQLLYVLTGVVLFFTVFYINSADFIMNFALYCGFVAGACWESHFVKYSVKAVIWIKILRVAIGIVLVVLVHMLLNIIMPALPIFVFMHYFLIAFWAIGVYPMLFGFL